MTVKLVRDKLGSPVPQSVEGETGEITVHATGDTTGINFGKTKLLRDALSSPIPNQIYDVEQGKWIIGQGGSGGGTGAVDSVNGKTGTVVLNANDVGAASATELDTTNTNITNLTGTVSTLSQTVSDNHTQVTSHLAQITLSDKGRINGQGVVVFTSDDAKSGDWENLKPIFEAYNVPLTIGVITNRIGTSTFLDTWHLKELVKIGWEITSHSVSHPENPYIPQRDLEFAENEYANSKQTLESLGFKVESYLTPYGQYSARERMIAKKHYRAARVSDYGSDGLNHSPIETYELKTLWMDEAYGQTDFDYYKTHIDKANELGALLIISTHGNSVSTEAYKSLVRQVVEYASINTRTMTLSKALDEFQNLVEVGDFTKSGKGNREAVGEHFVVGRDGKTHGNFTYIKKTSEVGIDSGIDDFSVGVTKIAVTYDHASNAPEGVSGLLTTCKMHTSSLNNYYGYNYQDYQIFNSNKVYRRFLKSDATWGIWELISQKSTKIDNLNGKDLQSPFSSFDLGLTYTPISYDHAVNSPSGGAGLLTTYKVYDKSLHAQYGYNYQEFRPFNSDVVYRRFLKADATWGEWELQAGVIIKNRDALNLSTPFSVYKKGITYTPISAAESVQTLDNNSGLLVTYKIIDVNLNLNYGYNYQDYQIFNSNKVYRRFLKSDTTWGEWKLIIERV